MLQCENLLKGLGRWPLDRGLEVPISVCLLMLLNQLIIVLRSVLFGMLVAVCCARFGHGQELANLEATLLPGALSIDPASLSGPILPVSGNATSTGSNQVDAVVFQLEGIRVVDLNGDGLGFVLTASPTILTTSGQGPAKRRELTLGSIPGFYNSSDPANTEISAGDPNTLTYLTGDGGEFLVDYEVRYDIPKFAVEGYYTGSIAFSVSAQ